MATKIDLPGSGDLPGGFSEKEFYLAEFRGRSLALVLADSAAAEGDVLRGVLDDFEANGTRCLLISEDATALGRLCGASIVDAGEPRWVGALWHAFSDHARAGLLAQKGELPRCARDAALRLRLAKLVWVEEAGGLRRGGGERLSYVDQADLAALLAGSTERAELLREIETMLASGLPSAAICAPKGVADELFTYAGSGTFFTRDRYIEVRNLGLDDFAAAHDLIHRGVEEGYLVARDETQIEGVLTNAFGVFVEGRYLAGIGTLIPHAVERAGELGSLYTLTRFAGGGVGRHLIRYAIDSARASGLRYVFACTTQARVVRFFEANGFEVVGPDDIPATKWRDYPEERRAGVTCMRHGLGPTAET